jgi:hypothetical protein
LQDGIHGNVAAFRSGRPSLNAIPLFAIVNSSSIPQPMLSRPPCEESSSSDTSS